MPRKLVALLSSPRLPLVALAVAVLLSLPALMGGLQVDDFFQRAKFLKLEPYYDGRSPYLSMFEWVMPDRASDPALINRGMYPWDASPLVKIGFFRPLSVAAARLDYALWPDNFVLQHLHSLLWYALAVLIVGRIYYRLPGPRVVAGLALLMFAVADSHAIPVEWLANRNSLLALVWAGLGLLFHLEWRQTHSLFHLFAALVGLTLGLFCGEAALGVFAYLVAYQLLLDPGPYLECLGRLLPYLAVIVAWRLIYSRLGFATSHTAFYIDPALNPLDFAAALLTRAPLLMVSQWFQVPADMLVFFPSRFILDAGLLAGVAVLFLIWVFWPLLRQKPEARFWALGMVLALGPLCAAFPMNRLLLFAGIGAFGLLSLIAFETGILGAEPTISGWRRTLARILVILHLWIAALLFPLELLTTPVWLGQINGPQKNRFPADPSIEHKTLIWINGNWAITWYSPLIRALNHQPVPGASYQLGYMSRSIQVSRTAENRLRLRQQNGFMPLPMDRIEWDPASPFRVGQRISRPEFDVEVLEVTPDGRPLTAEFTFRQSLDSPDYIWMCWSPGYHTCSPPPLGQTQTFPGGP